MPVESPSHSHLRTNVVPSSMMVSTGISFSRLTLLLRATVATSARVANTGTCTPTILAVVLPDSKLAGRCFYLWYYQPRFKERFKFTKTSRRKPNPSARSTVARTFLPYLSRFERVWDSVKTSLLLMSFCYTMEGCDDDLPRLLCSQALPGLATIGVWNWSR